MSRADADYVTTAQTIIRDPAAGATSVTQAEPTDLTLTVYFDNYVYVEAPGVTVRRVQTNVTPNATTTPTPGPQWPSATTSGAQVHRPDRGPNYTYSVFCNSSKATYVMAAPPFRLWSSGRIKFDTYPGGD